MDTSAASVGSRSVSDLLHRFATCTPLTPLIDRSVRDLLLHAEDDEDAGGSSHISPPGPRAISPVSSPVRASGETPGATPLDRAFQRAKVLNSRRVSQKTPEQSGCPRRRARAAASSVLRVESSSGAQLHWIATNHLSADAGSGLGDAVTHSPPLATRAQELRAGASASDSRDYDSPLALAPHDRAALMRLYHSTGRPADLIALPRLPPPH